MKVICQEIFAYCITSSVVAFAILLTFNTSLLKYEIYHHDISLLLRFWMFSILFGIISAYFLKTVFSSAKKFIQLFRHESGS